MTAISSNRLLGVQRTGCIRMMKLGFAVTLLIGLGFILTQNGVYRRLTFADGTKPGFTRELPVIRSKDQPERLQNLPNFKCHYYTCEKPPNLPELRLNEDQVVPSARNVTPGRSSLVFYNRVNKCGSNTLKTLMSRLQEQNHFQMEPPKTPKKREVIPLNAKLMRGLSWEKQKKMALQLAMMPNGTPVVFYEHVYFINFTRYGLDPPIYINMVRDPVDRFISLFYYHRGPGKWLPSGRKGQKYGQPPKWWFDKDLDDCVQKMEDPECHLKPGGFKETQLTFFCGHHPACMEIGNRGALQRAKRHVETAYSVVCVLEDLPTSMRVLEHYVPSFFRGISNVLAEKTPHGNAGSVRKTKKNVTEETKRVLRTMMPLNIEFYNFVKQRLYLQNQRIPE